MKPNTIKILVIAAIAVIFVVLMVVLVPRNAEVEIEDATSFEVTEEEILNYRELIGDGMEVKKSIFIIFNTEEECKSFIENHGSDAEPEKAGEGIMPMMTDGYYNVVGKSGVEAVFDSLGDGEYTKEPIVYSGKFCYLKRIGIYNPMDDRDKVKEMIISDKIAELAGDEK